MSDLRSPLAKARDDWMDSPEGMRCADPTILRSPDLTQYLRNRLEIAFLAGVEAATNLIPVEEKP